MTWTAIRVQAPGIERAAPAWAVGEWEMKVPGEDAPPALIVVQPNGDVLIEDHPYAFYGHTRPSGTLSPWGQLQYRVFAEDFLVLTMTGKLNPDGTGSGSGYAKERGIARLNRFTWTATKVPGPETQQGAPPWAVGNWTIMSKLGYVQEDHSLGDYTITETQILMAVRRDGSIAGGRPAYDASPRLGTIDSSGHGRNLDGEQRPGEDEH